MSSQLTLGITTIGDLLIENRITKTSSGESLEGIELTIPEYQRPYKWTAKNANQLLDDIEEAMYSNKEVYRVGTLILHQEKKQYNIVDGQQRTITFSLLLSCLGEKDNIRFLNQKLAENGYNRHNVMNNHRALERRIEKNFSDDDRGLRKKELADYIKDRCELIVVITDNISEAFQFFDSQNARGKTLYPHDLLKAYHLREMNGIDSMETERIVRMWEDLDQKKLAVLFNEYLYRLKEWVRGNRSEELTENNIDIFKGVSSKDNHPYAQFYKGAFAFSDEINRSNVPFVTGIQNLSPFQINTPIIAGKPFFEYTKHYFDILADVQNNNKYEGHFFNDNDIMRTLNLNRNKNGTGNRITRLMFDTAILLYVDRFCPATPSRTDLEFLDQFVVFAFVWAYSMRAQYTNVGWLVAQNYVMGNPSKDGIENGFNIYKTIAESDSPSRLLSRLADILVPLKKTGLRMRTENIETRDKTGVYENYLFFFKEYKYLED